MISHLHLCYITEVVTEVPLSLYYVYNSYCFFPPIIYTSYASHCYHYQLFC